MRTKTLLMVALALAFGVAAAWMANRWAQLRLSAGTQEAGQTVVVAALQIPFGKHLEEADVRVVRMPETAVPRGAFREVPKVIGRIATQTLYPGEVLLAERAVEHMGGSALAAVIGKERRAVTVRVNDVIGVAGFLLPGNRVDVIATRRKKDRKIESETLLQNKKVLAVDQTASPDKNEPVIVRAVTLELTPMEAERLVRATEEGTVQMALRNPLDETVQSASPPKVKRKPAKVVRRAPRARDHYVTVVKGIDVERHRVRVE